jgi:hypothetical protein
MRRAVNTDGEAHDAHAVLLPRRQTVSCSCSPSFGAAVAERDSEHTGLLSEGTRSTLECSRDGFDGRFVS